MTTAIVSIVLTLAIILVLSLFAKDLTTHVGIRAALAGFFVLVAALLSYFKG